MSQKRRRITAKMKQEIVLRMLRGETLDILSRERAIHQDPEGTTSTHSLFQNS